MSGTAEWQSRLDRMGINVQHERDVRDWSHVLGVTPDQLRSAVHEVGDRVIDVMDYCRQREPQAPDWAR